MIQPKTQLKIADNSGAKTVKCIKVLKGSFSTNGKLGDALVVSIKKLRFFRKVKIGEIYFALVLRTKKKIPMVDGSQTQFASNCVIILNKKKKILGTRIFGPVSKALRKKKFMRVLMLSGYNII
jgi:large subunit ribosomal protein L14